MQMNIEKMQQNLVSYLNEMDLPSKVESLFSSFKKTGKKKVEYVSSKMVSFSNMMSPSPQQYQPALTKLAPLIEVLTHPDFLKKFNSFKFFEFPEKPQIHQLQKFMKNSHFQGFTILVQIKSDCYIMKFSKEQRPQFINAGNKDAKDLQIIEKDLQQAYECPQLMSYFDYHKAFDQMFSKQSTNVIVCACLKSSIIPNKMLVQLEQIWALQDISIDMERYKDCSFYFNMIYRQGRSTAMNWYKILEAEIKYYQSNLYVQRHDQLEESQKPNNKKIMEQIPIEYPNQSEEDQDFPDIFKQNIQQPKMYQVGGQIIQDKKQKRQQKRIISEHSTELHQKQLDKDNLAKLEVVFILIGCFEVQFHVSLKQREVYIDCKAIIAFFERELAEIRRMEIRNNYHEQYLESIIVKIGNLRLLLIDIPDNISKLNIVEQYQEKSLKIICTFYQFASQIRCDLSSKRQFYKQIRNHLNESLSKFFKYLENLQISGVLKQTKQWLETQQFKGIPIKLNIYFPDIIAKKRKLINYVFTGQKQLTFGRSIQFIRISISDHHKISGLSQVQIVLKATFLKQLNIQILEQKCLLFIRNSLINCNKRVLQDYFYNLHYMDTVLSLNNIRQNLFQTYKSRKMECSLIKWEHSFEYLNQFDHQIRYFFDYCRKIMSEQSIIQPSASRRPKDNFLHNFQISLEGRTKIVNILNHFQQKVSFITCDSSYVQYLNYYQFLNNFSKEGPFKFTILCTDKTFLIKDFKDFMKNIKISLSDKGHQTSKFQGQRITLNNPEEHNKQYELLKLYLKDHEFNIKSKQMIQEWFKEEEYDCAFITQFRFSFGDSLQFNFKKISNQIILFRYYVWDGVTQTYSPKEKKISIMEYYLIWSRNRHRFNPKKIETLWALLVKKIMVTQCKILMQRVNEEEGYLVQQISSIMFGDKFSTMSMKIQDGDIRNTREVIVNILNSQIIKTVGKFYIAYLIQKDHIIRVLEIQKCQYPQKEKQKKLDFLNKRYDNSMQFVISFYVTGGQTTQPKLLFKKEVKRIVDAFFSRQAYKSRPKQFEPYCYQWQITQK